MRDRKIAARSRRLPHAILGALTAAAVAVEGESAMRDPSPPLPLEVFPPPARIELPAFGPQKGVVEVEQGPFRAPVAVRTASIAVTQSAKSSPLKKIRDLRRQP